MNTKNHSCCSHSPHSPPPHKHGRGYTCPMHPQITQEQPGSCPLCGMALEPFLPTGDEEENGELKEMSRRFWVSLLFLIPLLCLSFFPEMGGWIQAIFATPLVLWGGWPFFKRGWSSLIRSSLNMFTLISMGVGISYLYSIIAVCFPSLFPDSFKDQHHHLALYFETAGVITTLVLLGQLLELRARDKTGQALRALLNLTPKITHLVSRDKSEKEIPLEEVKIGDWLRVKPGEKVPTDGIILEGGSSLDESMISGEPFPLVKSRGERVIGGTLNGNGSFIMQVEKIGGETFLAKIVHLVSEAQRSHAPIQKLADTISSYCVPLTLLIALITFIIWSAIGPPPAFSHALINAVAVLMIACPCALGLATPMSITVGIGKGAMQGILIKNAEALEMLSKVDLIVIDKTGTLTEGRPSLSTILCISEKKEDEVIQLAASLEIASEHPLGAPLIAKAKEKGIELLPLNDFKNNSGKGVIGTIHGKRVAIGNQRLLADLNVEIPSKLAEPLYQEDQTVLFLVFDRKVVALFGLSDKIKESSKEGVEKLHQAALHIVMLTGDNQKTALAIAHKLNIDRVEADLLPEDKYEIIKKFQKEGYKVAMVGDGINDAPALALADVGIAMGTGTDVAIESAPLTLVKGDLREIARARTLSLATMRNIRQNLWFAFLYNALGIPLAAGVFYPFFGILLNPMIASIAMTCSSISVIINALRLKKQKI